MKKLLDSIKFDIKLNFYNKSIFVVFFLMILSFLIVNYNMLGKFKTDLEMYARTYEEMEACGENIDELLSQEANVMEEITSKDTVQQLIDNPLRYDYDNLINSYTYIKGANIIVGLLENSTLIFIGLLAGIYMIYLITYEFSEKTIKTRLLMDKPIRLLLSKLLSGILIFTVIYFLALLISWCISFVWSEYTLSSIDVDIEYIKFGFDKVMMSVFISYLISFLFLIMGFAIGLLLRKMSLSILTFLVLHLIAPSVGKYDYKNLILTIFSSGFELDMGKRMNFIEGVGFIPSLLIFMVYVFIIIGISIFIYILKKRKGGYV